MVVRVYTTAEEARAAKVEPLWTPSPVQAEALVRWEREILFGGARGGGKSSCGIVWLVSGNPATPTNERKPVDISYINHPNYRALVLRKNEKDLEDWVGKARELYSALGAKFTSRPATFVWPHPEFPDDPLGHPGATIIVGHLDTADAYEKYQGQEFSRILFEEITQVPREELYVLVLGSLRSPYPEMRKQAFLTANPGGSGHGWTRARFVKPPTHDGGIFPSKATITWDPRPAPRGTNLRKSGTTRVFIPALPSDNTVMMERDPLYVDRLIADLALTPSRQRAWVYGDWDAVAGSYFESFRSRWIEGEPKNAVHVIPAKSTAQPGWWHRWGGLDWGYVHDSAVHLACQHPDERVHIYKEMTVSRCSPTELGAQMAHWLMPDIDGLEDHAITIYASHDAFSQKTEDRTISEMIARGIEQILGPDSVYIPDLADLPSGPSFWARHELQKSAVVILRASQKLGVAAWQYMHSLMRWWPLVTPSISKIDMEYAMSVLKDTTQGLEKYNAYMREFQKVEETLPKLQIWDSCPKLIAAIPRAMCADPDKGRDPENIDPLHFDGRDALDSCGHLLLGHKRELQNREPFRTFFERRMAPVYARTDDGNALVWAARKAERDYEGSIEVPFTPHRAARRRPMVQ